MAISTGQWDRDAAIGLVEVEPDLVRTLSAAGREEARRVALPVGVVEKGADAQGLVDELGAFGGLVLDGLLLEAVTIGEHVTLRLLGPGAPMPASSLPSPLPPLATRLVAAARTRVVLLDERYLLATRCWPWLARALHARMSEHARRDRAQLAISHLPRVEDRLMALMWLLADGWGRVTPAGVRIDLSLSHEVLGGLIGARRPTVTLAVGKLAERNALIRQDEQWLIVEPPVSPEAIGDLPPLGVASRRLSPWGATEREGASAGPDRRGADLEELRALSAQGKDRARRLRERSAVLHAQSAALAAEIFATGASARERSGEDTLGHTSDPLLSGRRSRRARYRGDGVRRSVASRRVAA